MTSQRSRAYGRVMRTLEELAPSKLLPDELAIVREAADTLLFSEDLDAHGAREALSHVEALLVRLVETERWTPERAQQLGDDIAACGPVTMA